MSDFFIMFFEKRSDSENNRFNIITISPRVIQVNPLSLSDDEAPDTGNLREFHRFLS